MSAGTGAALLPVAVWDARKPGWVDDKREARVAWLREHGLPADEMYRAEFFLADTPFARVFCYALNGDGRRYLEGHDPDREHDHSACEVATRPPRDVPLSGFPPRDLLGAVR